LDFILHLAAGFLIGFVAAISPGPDTVLVLRSVLVGGSGAGARAGLGIGTALTIHALIALALVGVVRDLAGSIVISVIKIAGAAYLAHIGSTLLQNATELNSDDGKPITDADQQKKRYFVQGFISNLTNPKAIVFFASAVGQFVSARDGASSVAVLAGVVAAAPIWFLLLSFFLAKVMWRLTARSRLIVDRVAGFLLLALSCLAALSAFQ